MHISTAHKKVVLNLRHPHTVLAPIPTAKTFNYKGHELVAVPHGIDETQVLNNLGFKVPSPIIYDYKWSGQFKPFDAQKHTADFLVRHNRAFVLNEMGTGKSLSALWAYDYLRSKRSVRTILVVAPLSTLESTWADEVFAHFMHLQCVVLHGSRARRLKLLKSNADVFLINHDGVNVIKQELIDKNFDVVCIDEIAAFRNVSTVRWKAMHAVAAKAQRVWGMTGTPTPTAPTDAYGQCRIISPERVSSYFGAFRESVMRRVSQFQWVPKDCATEIVTEAMQPAIRYTRDSCVDIPDCMYEVRQVTMTPEQTKAYKSMMTTLKAELAQGKITAVNAAVKVGKLVQIAGGVVYDSDGNEVVVGAPDRVSEVRDIVEQAGGKVIVFVPYRSMIEYVAQELRKDYNVGVIHGGVGKDARATVFREFQKGRTMQVLVAQPAAMSHGLTLTAASTIVWYAPVTSTETYIQANARITRPGQRNKQFIINIVGTPIEHKINQALKKKQKLQDEILDILEALE